MTILSVRHLTTYRYRHPVALGEHRIRFRPRDSHDQRLLESTIAITPEPASLRWVHDVFGNCVAVARFSGRTDAVRFDCRIVVDHAAIDPLDFQLADHAAEYPFGYDAEEMPDLLRLIERRARDPGRVVDDWARSFLPAQGRIGTRALLAAITTHIRASFAYLGRSEQGVQDPVQTLRLKRGSCRDFALLMMEAVRSLGMAARFVSGYLHVPDGGALGGGHVTRHQGGGATHAWVQIFLPGAGWIEFDPTNGIVGNRDLVRVAVARDPTQALPLHGTWTGYPDDEVGMEVDVDVRALPARADHRADPPLAHPVGSLPAQAAPPRGTRASGSV